MYICNILCSYLEYRYLDGKWKLYAKNNTNVDSYFIQNILDSSYYFNSMGGTQDIKFRRNRRFGMQVSKITCISFCGCIKKVFLFSYNNAK